MTTSEEQNKAFVLDAFDTLFNKRDYAAAERFWSPPISSTVLISRRGARGSSNLLRPRRKSCITRTR